MNLNRKGFTMLELLAAIIILGILAGLAGGAVKVYLDRTKEKSYNIMAVSARQGAEQYIMEFPEMAMTKAEYDKYVANPTSEATEIKQIRQKVMTFQELVEEQMMSETVDPADTSQDCTGKVIAILNEANANNERELDSYSFVVHQCCMQKRAKYTFSEKYVKKGTNKVCDPDKESNCDIIEEQNEEYEGVLCD